MFRVHTGGEKWLPPRLPLFSRQRRQGKRGGGEGTWEEKGEGSGISEGGGDGKVKEEGRGRKRKMERKQARGPGRHEWEEEEEGLAKINKCGGGGGEARKPEGSREPKRTGSTGEKRGEGFLGSGAAGRRI